MLANLFSGASKKYLSLPLFGALKPHAVSEAFYVWAKRSGLDTPFYGAHCMKTAFSSALAPVIERHLAIKQALGRRYDQHRGIFLSLVQFLSEKTKGDHELTAETFLQWCQTLEHLKNGMRRNRMREVRNLCLYRQRHEPNCFVPDSSLFPSLHQPARPYIFSPSEIGRMLEETWRLQRKGCFPLRPGRFRLIVILLLSSNRNS